MAELDQAKAFFKRDALQQIEAQMQSRWDTEKLFDVDAPQDKNKPKFMITFPFPYMNGRLHLGHSFSLSKCEFAAGYQMLKGNVVLFPFAFHCTGMPIKACADKLKSEIARFGNPPQFPRLEDAIEPVEHGAGVKSKVAAKTGNFKYQWQIMRSIGLEDHEIPDFQDPQHWLTFFPPHAIKDLKRMGCRIDWRRTFITTDANPYFDSFVRWQFEKLKKLDKVQFGKRHTVFSPLDGQPCMDHDRSSGEGVGPQEYTAIKLRVLEPLPAVLSAFSGRTVSLVAATLRPETMYGQTNCFVGTELEYIAFEDARGDILIATERAALNMAFQALTRAEFKVAALLSLKGKSLIGCKVKAPLSAYEYVHVLPMEQILANKGTGIVTSCPSGSADDYVMLTALQKKPAYYNIQEEWVKGFEPVAMIHTATYGDLGAVKYCKDAKINSPKDKLLLDQAKEALYKEDYYKGTMLVGTCKGRPVQEAKPIIRQELIDANDAFPYYEPEKEVISRSGDICVVSLTDQWYLNYGEENWKREATHCVDKMEFFHDETRNAFNGVLDWLGQWACSRSFGLGTKIPWDPQYLIESLSDSTIYMAYYTVAHMLQHGSLTGSDYSGSDKIDASAMTYDVWDYILSDGPVPSSCDIPAERMAQMKAEFNYFYPMDVRCSGKDLIPNHLTFAIYNHVALFPEAKWPLGMRSNGHLLVDGEKMAKSKGNFITLSDAIAEYSADAMRLTLAVAGDGVDDANFGKDVVNQSILRLFTLKEWIDEIYQHVSESGDGKMDMYRADGDYLFDDNVFLHSLYHLGALCEQEYAKTFYREAVTFGFYEFTNARDKYMLACAMKGTKPHLKLLKQYIEWQVILLTPICPHLCDYLWREKLKMPGSVQHAQFPRFEVADANILAAATFIETLLRNARLGRINYVAQLNKKLKKGESPAVVDSFQSAKIYLADAFPAWQTEIVQELKDLYDPVSRRFPLMGEQQGNSKALVAHFSAKPQFAQRMKTLGKKFMPFLMTFVQDVISRGAKAFDRQLPFDQKDVIRDNCQLIKASLGLQSLDLENAPNNENEEGGRAEPGTPVLIFSAN